MAVIVSMSVFVPKSYAKVLTSKVIVAGARPLRSD